MLLQAYRTILSGRGVDIFEQIERVDWAEESAAADNNEASGAIPEGTVDKEEFKKPNRVMSFFKKGKSKSGDKPKEDDKGKEEKKKEKPRVLKDWRELALPDEGRYSCVLFYLA